MTALALAHDPTSRYVAWLEHVYRNEPERFIDVWDRTVVELVMLADRHGVAVYPDLRRSATRIARGYLAWRNQLPPLGTPEGVAR